MRLLTTTVAAGLTPRHQDVALPLGSRPEPGPARHRSRLVRAALATESFVGSAVGRTLRVG